MSNISVEALLNTTLDQLQGYQIVDMDQNPGGTSYYGYNTIDGRWIIMRQIDTGVVSAYTFAKGDSGYDFSNRASETYDTFSNTF